MLNAVLVVVHLIVSVLLIGLILMHSGKDAGMASSERLLVRLAGERHGEEPHALHGHHRHHVLHHHLPAGVEAGLISAGGGRHPDGGALRGERKDLGRARSDFDLAQVSSTGGAGRLGNEVRGPRVARRPRRDAAQGETR